MNILKIKNMICFFAIIFSSSIFVTAEPFIFAQVDIEETEKINRMFGDKKLDENDVEFAKAFTNKRVYGYYDFENDSDEKNIDSILVVENENVLDSSMIKKAEWASDFYSQYVINLNFDEQGTAILGEYTSHHIGKNVAIIINDKAVVNAVIKSSILGGALQIAGMGRSFDYESFFDLLKDYVDEIDYTYDKNEFKIKFINFEVYKLNLDLSDRLTMYSYYMFMGVTPEVEEEINALFEQVAYEKNIIYNGIYVYVYETEPVLNLNDFKKAYFIESDVDTYGVMLALNENGQEKWKSAIQNYDGDENRYFIITYNGTGFLIDIKSKNEKQLLVDYMEMEYAKIFANDFMNAIKENDN